MGRSNASSVFSMLFLMFPVFPVAGYIWVMRNYCAYRSSAGIGNNGNTGNPFGEDWSPFRQDRALIQPPRAVKRAQGSRQVGSQTLYSVLSSPAEASCSGSFEVLSALSVVCLRHCPPSDRIHRRPSPRNASPSLWLVCTWRSPAARENRMHNVESLFAAGPASIDVYSEGTFATDQPVSAIEKDYN
jgi:hypothetical protein